MPISLLCCSGSLEGGGSERQLWQLASEISKQRFVSSVYLLYRRGVFLDRLPATVTVDDFWSQHKSSDFRLPGSIHAAQVRHLLHVLRRENTQVVYDRTYHMTLITAAACRQADVPRVSVIVSPPSRDFGNARERFAWWKKRRLRRAYSQPDQLTIAVSGSVADDAATFYGIDRRGIAVVPSPIDMQAVSELAGESLPGSETSSEALCVVGRLSREKGQELAIRAFAQICHQAGDTKLDLIGDGPCRSRLERMAVELGIQDQVRFLGFLHNPYPHIKAARALVIPSKYEGLPNVALEAMALRCPVMATPCGGGLAELLGSGVRGDLLSDRSPEKLAARMLAVIEGKNDPSRVDVAQQWISKYHSLPVWLERMETLLEMVATGTLPTDRGEL